MYTHIHIHRKPGSDHKIKSLKSQAQVTFKSLKRDLPCRSNSVPRHLGTLKYMFMLNKYAPYEHHTVRPVSEHPIWKNGPGPWEMGIAKGHVEVKMSNGSGI